MDHCKANSLTCRIPLTYPFNPFAAYILPYIVWQIAIPMPRPIILLLLVLLACQSHPEDSSISSPDDSPAVVYEVFVQAFADGDGDGIGDLTGLTQKLSYIRDLGADAIWLMPIHPSPSYHKYDVVDYRAIHPDYGTMDDFKVLLDSAHQMGLKIMLDLVINHSSDQHPWFQAALAGAESPYRDYYVWADYDSIKHELEKKSVSLDSDNLTQWHLLRGQAQAYYGFFWGGMPDFNFDSPELRKEIYEIGRFWLEEIGVDGFRLDAARHIYPDDQAEKSHQFWEEFRGEMMKIKPDVYLVGEVYEKPEIVTPYLKGLPALFNFGLAEAIIQTINQGRDSGLVAYHQAIQEAYRAVNPDFIDATLLSNHDQNRIRSALGGSQAKARLAASILFTLPGTPYIYYGEEIGMLGQKPDEYIREPFLWGEGDPAQTSWIEPRYSLADSVANGEDQRIDSSPFSSSFYQNYRELIVLRKSEPLLTKGLISPIPGLPEGLLGYFRYTESDTLVVVHNLSDTAISLSTQISNVYRISPKGKFIWPQKGLLSFDLHLPNKTQIYRY